ncbi:MAG: hypothetical protein PWR30_246 [Candidatus Woesearchaeota archaeon]|nr:hypothetical protein [Candidatus Woesearchaeota archaeon]
MNHRNRKKGQAMLFIVLALVLVFVFILVFSIMSQNKEDIVENGKETEENIALNTIEGCVSRKISEELLNFGRRGLLEEYDVVPVVMERPEEIEFIYWNRYSPFICEGKDYSKDMDPFEDNSLILKDDCWNKEVYDVWDESRLNFNGLEYNFEELVMNILNDSECYSFENEAYGFNVNPASNLHVDATFGKDELILDVERTVQIDFNDGSSNKINSKVRETMDVRIGDLIDFANTVILYDGTNLSFNPAAYHYDNFHVEIDEDQQHPYKADETIDVLKFIDEKSRVNGHNFELWIGRENVWPIISFTPANVTEKSDGSILNYLEEVYINISNPTLYLPGNVFLYNFIGNCSNNETEMARINLLSYLSTQISFYDRDEDNLNVSNGTDLDCSKFPMNKYNNYSFSVEFNLTDGKLNDSSKISFKLFREDDVSEE